MMNLIEVVKRPVFFPGCFGGLREATGLKAGNRVEIRAFVVMS